MKALEGWFAVIAIGAAILVWISNRIRKPPILPPIQRPAGLVQLKTVLAEEEDRNKSAEENVRRAEEWERECRIRTVRAWNKHYPIILAAIERVQEVLNETHAGFIVPVAAGWHDATPDPEWFGVALHGFGSGTVRLMGQNDLLVITPVTDKGRIFSDGWKEFFYNELKEDVLANDIADALLSVRS